MNPGSGGDPLAGLDQWAANDLQNLSDNWTKNRTTTPIPGVEPYVPRGGYGGKSSAAKSSKSANSGAGMSDAEIARLRGAANNRRAAGQMSDIRGSVTPGSDTPRDTIVSNAEAEEMGRRVLRGDGGGNGSGSNQRASSRTSPAGVAQTGTSMGFDWDKFGRDVRNPFTSVQLPETTTQFNPALNGENADAFDPNSPLGQKYADAETMKSANAAAGEFDWNNPKTELPFDIKFGEAMLGKYGDGSHAGYNHAPGEHSVEFDGTGLTKEQQEEKGEAMIRGKGLRNDGLPGRRGRSGVNGTDFSRDYGEPMTSAPMTDERRRARDAFLNAEDTVMGVRAAEDTMGIGHAGGQSILRTGDGKDDYVKVSKEGVRAYKDGRISAQELKDGYVTDLIGGKKDIPPTPSEAQNPGAVETSTGDSERDWGRTARAFNNPGLEIAPPQGEDALSTFQTVNLDPDQKTTEWAFNNPGVVPTGAKDTSKSDDYRDQWVDFFFN